MTVNHQRQDFKKYEPMLHKLARKAFGRLCQGGGEGRADYEDVFQEAAISFLKAEAGFKEAAGVQFITYLWRTVETNLGRWVREQLGDAHHEVSAETIVSSEDEGDPIDFFDLVQSDALSPEEVVSRKQGFVHNLKRIKQRSGAAYDIVRNVIELQDETEAAFDMLVTDQQRKIAAGETAASARVNISLPFIVTHCCGGDKKVRRKAIEDITAVYGDLLSPGIRF